MLVIFVSAALLSIVFLVLRRRPRHPSSAPDTLTMPDVRRDPPVSCAPETRHAASARSQYGSIVDNDEDRFGLVLYDGPPVDVEMVYGKPAYDTLVESTMARDGQAITVSASMMTGIDDTSRRVTVERIRGHTGPQYVI